ncbi:uncharacterized protein LOC142224321 [Haematobia irritans]|uniref:uncharacterized protein LOC142224321 n=1 Tax=Haematobia irritans TaxID=7368 RepID=UPI003F502673
MFPQSELDNYKLQVELLQEKLQRSEISRQQLEHKLDKILHKKEEHDRMVRSKSKQRYQQFLEEQHRRNERNKQLVQMLERIEQQTAAMNARSERLKMMKLQYEMYFAKLVHSQTRRCLQSSSIPILGPMTTASSIQIPGTPTRIKSSQIAEGYNYSKIYEEPHLFENKYKRHGADPILMERESSLLCPQQDILPSSTKLMEMPILEYTLSSSRSDPMQIGTDPFHMQTYANNPAFAPKENKFCTTEAREENRNIEPQRFDSTSNKLEKSGKYPEFDLPTSISTSSEPLTFDRELNAKTLSDIALNSNNSKSQNNNDDVRGFNDKISNRQSPDFDQTSSTISNTNQDKIMEKSSQPLPHEVNKSTVRSDHTENITKSVIEPSPAEGHSNKIEKLPNIYTGNDKPEDLQPESVNSNISSVGAIENQPTTPVSIENIENAIYGELVNPAEDTQNIQQAEKPSVSPALLDNLVTESPSNMDNTIESIVPAKEDPQVNIIEDKGLDNNTKVPMEQNEIDPSNTQTYAQSEYDYNVNTNPTENPTNSTIDYTGYENNSNTAAGDLQGQEQQYDYSNYDPSQYSYPGYIYDEATGEYKPDPNATAEQYATDQQYTEGYQYQEQTDYAYDQTYDQQNSQQTPDPVAYENYEDKQSELTTMPESENKSEEQTNDTSNLDPADIGKGKPTSILATADKKDAQKNKKRVNFVDSSETDESSMDKLQGQPASAKPNPGNESDFDFSSGSETANATQA